MLNPPAHIERHLVARIGWLRAAILGANDGIVSTASLIVGVASASASTSAILTAGTAGLAAGAMSMAAGEYVSVSSQLDTERADIERETKELREEPAAELEELVSIYENRGLERNLAVEVARHLMERDPLGTHLRDELGMFEQATARPVQAALTSAAAFSIGAALPLLAAVLAPANLTSWAVSGSALISLAILGSVGAAAGGAGMAKAAARVTFWGAFAMAVTAAIGAVVGTAVG